MTQDEAKALFRELERLLWWKQQLERPIDGIIVGVE